MPATLSALAPRLRCPNCGAPLAAGERALGCDRGHRFDIARHGYVSLLPPRRRAAAGDPAEMVAARAAFLGAGHYAAIARAVTAAARDAVPAPATVVDAGAGTGYHLAALLEAMEGCLGVALDASRPALRRALRAHPRIAGIACDVWQELPLQGAAADVIVNVFAPRNAGEIARVLVPGGALVVVTPTPRHLHELVRTLGMVGVEPGKPDRLHADLAPHLGAAGRRRVEFEMALDHGAVEALFAMGPSAHHVGAAERRRRVSLLPAPARVTASVTVETFRRR